MQIEKSMTGPRIEGNARDESLRFPISNACERAIAGLGEGNVPPLETWRLQQLKNVVSAGPEASLRIYRPFSFGTENMRWSELKSLRLDELKKAIGPYNESAFIAGIDSLALMGVTSIDREILVTASWDHTCLKAIGDDETRRRFFATRLSKLDGYVPIKVYAIALRLMELRDEWEKRGGMG